MIEVQNTLPEKDDRGRLGFVCTLKMGATGYDPAQLPPKKLQNSDETKSWFLPKAANINGVIAEAGAELVVGTRGLGYYISIPLPKGKQVYSSAKKIEDWRYRDDQYNRRNLMPEFTGKCVQ